MPLHRLVAARVGVLRELLDIGDADGRGDEQAVDDGLPHHARLGVRHVRRAELPRIDEGAQQVDRRDADDCHRQLDLQHAGIDV